MSESNVAGTDYYWPVVAGKLWLPAGRPALIRPADCSACFRIDLPQDQNTVNNDARRHWIALSDEPQWLAQEHWVNLRDLLDELSPADMYWAGRALQIGHWWHQHKFCSSCARALPAPAPELLTKGEIVRICTACQTRYYPTPSPCIIVLVTNGEYCLLAQHQRSRTGTYSALAGFVEAGEPIEQTVEREVLEEVGLTVKQLEYVTSQSWPFPAQLMLGFYAQYDSGAIVPQLDEIREAHWYHYSELPKVPPAGTIARQLIDGFIHRCEMAASEQR
ncbi:NAD(+) diphosphatase [Gilvimarinus polysaccharolyticus]|uniref:NAD(+) diphosphatase n=1 Tax=Gilvimarinus polysaccharolyticus TaxID=863921 RepID=UPI0006737906|nr:NAD(+) diphosphatase [Gilvimarinus polysaccharolyticus]